MVNVCDCPYTSLLGLANFRHTAQHSYTGQHHSILRVAEDPCSAVIQLVAQLLMGSPAQEHLLKNVVLGLPHFPPNQFEEWQSPSWENSETHRETLNYHMCTALQILQ